MKWKHSKLRFYILNTLWNYKFWLFAEKIYKEHVYEIDEDGLDLSNIDDTWKIKYKKKKISKRRFVGYMYNGMMHLDNPGFRHTIKKETWYVWKKKGLIKNNYGRLL